MRKGKLALLGAWLASRKLVAAAGLFCLAMLLLLFWLYDLPAEVGWYGVSLCLAGVLLLSGLSFVRFWHKHKVLTQLEESILVDPDNLPEATTLIEADYSRLIRRLARDARRQQAEADGALVDRTAYYTLWVHQIKTPIATLDLLFQTGPEKKAEMEVELQKIQQYVDMVLQYQRLDGDSRDLVLRRCQLDDVVRQTVRKFAKLFILKKIRLVFQETGATVLSDEKWLPFLLEQLLSNALKYTPVGGEISVFWEEDHTLVVADNGIGIAPEDLPRVFERGFTGQNGRMENKSTGIGLYLCRRTADLLGHSLTITSVPGEGTQVRLGLRRPSFAIE